MAELVVTVRNKIAVGDGQRIIATTTDSMQEDGGAAHTAGTITEQAFDVIQWNHASGKIYMTRIGRGEDREFANAAVYGGIECGIDNAKYSAGNGLYNATDTDSDMFVTVLYDTGLTTQRIFRFADGTEPNVQVGVVREFVTSESVSNDYLKTSPTFTSSCRYFSMSMSKSAASRAYLLDLTNEEYVFKGDDV